MNNKQFEVIALLLQGIMLNQIELSTNQIWLSVTTKKAKEISEATKQMQNRYNSLANMIENIKEDIEI